MASSNQVSTRHKCDSVATTRHRRTSNPRQIHSGRLSRQLAPRRWPEAVCDCCVDKTLLKRRKNKRVGQAGALPRHLGEQAAEVPWRAFAAAAHAAGGSRLRLILALLRLGARSTCSTTTARTPSVVAMVHTLADEFAAEIKQLCETTVADQQWREFLNAHVPLTDPQGHALEGRSATHARLKRAALVSLYRHRHDPRCAPWLGTAHGVLAAVNTYEHHENSVRGAAGLTATCCAPSPVTSASLIGGRGQHSQSSFGPTERTAPARSDRPGLAGARTTGRQRPPQTAYWVHTHGCFRNGQLDLRVPHIRRR